MANESDRETMLAMIGKIAKLFMYIMRRVFHSISWVQWQERYPNTSLLQLPKLVLQEQKNPVPAARKTKMSLKLGAWAFQDLHNMILWSWMRQMMKLNVDEGGVDSENPTVKTH